MAPNNSEVSSGETRGFLGFTLTGVAPVTGDWEMKKLFCGLTIAALGAVLMFAAMRYFSPPITFSPEREQAYAQIVAFARAHRSWGDFYLDPRAELVGQRKTRDKQAERQARRLALLLKQTSTMLVRREGKMLIFYSGVLDLTPSSRSGYVYSTDGSDPNRVGGRLIKGSRPLHPLRGQWYSSNNIPTYARQNFRYRGP